AATTVWLWAGLRPLRWGVESVKGAGSAAEYRCSRSCDIAVKTCAWREIFVVGLKNTIEARLTLLNQSAHRVEATQEAVGLFDRRYVGPVQSQIQHEFRSDRPAILGEIQRLS